MQNTRLFKGILKHHFGATPRSRKIFVLGTGRSGTHWLGDIIGAHPDITANVENPPIFPWVTRMAIAPETEGRLYPKLVRRYCYEHAAVTPRHYLDKSHPNIWLAEQLARTFPEALFVAARRDAFGTVNSMLQHAGVMEWIHRWQEYPLPNRFLGIPQNHAETYAELPLEGKCAVRWRAHILQLAHLEKTLGPRLAVFDYDCLQDNTKVEMERMREFLSLNGSIPIPTVKRSSLERWRHELSLAQQSNIAEAIEKFPVYHAGSHLSNSVSPA
ncbi:sulfotransferase [Thioalkalivibrio sp. ALE12]|uniref:sulfotransferase family protein n=1 Tax=Thioalkalivibrio sp. ALE12 TaxID=1158170 RepID=UPI0009DA86E9|nr:sulfotransferase [Thioalkalivibrio sp. ALE12]